MIALEEKTLAHYAISHRLARGGMSEVYLAHDTNTQQPVAIKVVNRSEDDYFVRFQREVKTLSALTHEHILPIIEYGEHGPWHYCVMPYIEHGTLREHIANGPLTQQEAGSILEQVATALQFAHDHGILHRDIKPSNILLKDEQHVYLADFGLAKGVEEGNTVTQTGCLIGTPEYMAPELAEVPATTSSDIYALGILLYQMLTGRVPFKGSTPLSIYWKHIKEEPLPPSQLNPAISYSVEQVILRALQKDPQRRFKTVQAMAQAYKQALQASEQTLQDEVAYVLRGLTLAPPTQRVISVPARSTYRRVHPAVAALIAAMFLLVIPLSLGFTTYRNDAPPVLGASAQFARINHTLHEEPAKPSFVASNIHPSNKKSPSPVQTYSGQGSTSQGNGHGHKRGHKHGG